MEKLLPSGVHLIIVTGEPHKQSVHQLIAIPSISSYLFYSVLFAEVFLGDALAVRFSDELQVLCSASKQYRLMIIAVSFVDQQMLPVLHRVFFLLGVSNLMPPVFGSPNFFAL